MNGRKGMSGKTAEKICTKLGIVGREKEVFNESVRAQFSRNKSVRFTAVLKLEHLKRSGSTEHLQMDVFKTISSWYHFALIELLKRKGSQNRSLFAKRLGIAENEVEAAIARLKRLNLITQVGAGWRVNQDTVIADYASPAEAIRNFHRQVMEKGLKALDQQSVDERYGSSSVLPIKVKSLKKAKELIQEFRIKLTNEISDHQEAEEIYGLSIQFFRLTEIITKETP